MATSPSSSSPHGPRPEQAAEALRLRGLADALQHKAGAAYLASTAGKALGPGIPPKAFGVYLQNLLDEAGQPTDPIERMLLEQITLAHHTLGRLYVSAAESQNLDQARVFYSAAVRLLAEFRRTSLALKKYREPTAPKNVVVVKQQNLAQNQQVAFVDGQLEARRREPTEPPEPTRHRNTELESNQVLDHVPPEGFFLQPQTGRRREAELVEAKRPHRRGPGTAAAGGVGP